MTLGFIIAGVVIGLGAGRQGIGNFIVLAVSGLGLGVVFLALGLVVSILCRTRVQSLVVALLMWCAAVFVFDLVALGVVVSTRSHEAAAQIETITDATHVNAVADMHQAFETGTDSVPKAKPVATKVLFWTFIANPVDSFRAINLRSAAECKCPSDLFIGLCRLDRCCTQHRFLALAPFGFMKTRTILTLFTVLTVAVVVSAFAIHRQSPANKATLQQAAEQSFEVKGRVVSIEFGGKTVHIAHEDIPDFMPAMTMPFTLAPRAGCRPQCR